MEDDLKKNKKWKTTSNKKMEDDLKQKNGRRPKKKIKNGRRPQKKNENRKLPQFFLKLE